MENYIKKKNVLGVFSDTAGAKAVLSYLSLFKASAKKIQTNTNKYDIFYEEFDLDIIQIFNHKSIKIPESINFLVTGTSVPASIELEYIRQAKLKKIFSITFVDHWTELKSRFQLKGESIFPDKIVVIDKKAKKIAINEGIPESLITIMSNPYYQFLKNWSPSINRDELYKLIGIDNSKPYILYAPEPLRKYNLMEKYGFDELDGLNFLHGVLSNLKKDYYVLIKPHPNESTLMLKNKTEDLNNLCGKYKYIDYLNINILMYYAKFNIGFFSNSLIESSILGVKTLRLLNLLKNKKQDPLKHLSEKFINVNNSEYLEELLLSQ